VILQRVVSGGYEYLGHTHNHDSCQAHGRMLLKNKWQVKTLYIVTEIYSKMEIMI
jgi:hypothetical protein